MNGFTHHTAKAAVVLLGGRSLPQTDIIETRTALKTEGIEGRERIGDYKRLVVGGWMVAYHSLIYKIGNNS